MEWTEKAGTVDFETPKYSWTQTIEEIQVTVPLPEGTRAKNLDVDMKSKKLRVKLKSEEKPIIEGELFNKIDVDESFWTVEDNELKFMLTKVTSHDSWKSLIKGEYEVDPLTIEEMNRKMMLEKFQNENPGFDFSGASFSGQVPKDPKNFMKFD